MNKFNFIIELLGGAGSRISSKRSVMIWFVLLFTYLIVLNAYTGKSPSSEFRTELFQLTVLSIVLVFGEIALKIYQAIRGKNIDLPPASPDPQKTPDDTKK